MGFVFDCASVNAPWRHRRRAESRRGSSCEDSLTNDALHIPRAAAILLYTLVLGPVCCLVALFDRSGAIPLSIARLWIRWILWTCGIEVQASGLEKLAPERPCLYMSNHSSMYDIAAILITLPGPVRFVAKRELVRVPVFGWAMALSGHLVVDRGNRAKVIESLQRGVALLRGGASLVVFPEGSRSPEGQLRNFKNGGFQMALDAGVPVVPVSIMGSGRLTRGGTWRVDGGRVRVDYGAPIPTEGLGPGDRPLLKKTVRQAILAGLEEMAGR
jgi:1-acyl-sn-glycerol-3-phosphate acyltransferase